MEKSLKTTGFRDKLFWVMVSFISAGVIAIVAMVWSLVVDMQVMKITDSARTVILEKTWEKANENNKILNTKADQQTNEEEHKQIMIQLTNVSEQMQRIIMRVYGQVYKQDTSYLVEILDTVVPLAKLPIVLKIKKNI